VLTAIFLGYIKNWSGAYIFVPFIVLTSNVTDGTQGL